MNECIPINIIDKNEKLPPNKIPKIYRYVTFPVEVTTVITTVIKIGDNDAK